MAVLNLYKKEGETPLERLNRFRKENPKYKEKKLTYAGRLDPLAEGVLLVLEGESIKQKQKFLALPKEYYFEILWGFETDTFDVLGKVTSFKKEKIFVNQGLLEQSLKEIKNLRKLSYPPFSSKPVLGQPLFKWAREDPQKSFSLPEKEIEIFRVRHLESFKLPKSLLESFILNKISLVEGDFRQKEIISIWQKTFNSLEKDSFMMDSFRAKVSSGTYIRRLSELFGKKLKIGALCFKIIREKVGDFSIKQSQS